MIHEPPERTAIATLEPSASLSAERVLAVHHWNEHLFSFTITRPPSFRFRSGEFVMIGLQGDNGKPLLRAYSVASPAYADHLEFLSIKAPGGLLTSRLQKIDVGDEIYLGRKSTGTLVADALIPGRRLFLLGTGTGLAPWMAVIRDSGIYDQFEQVVVVVHSVRRVSDLAYRELLESRLRDDPLVCDIAPTRLTYIPTVTREPFHTTGRIERLMESGGLFAGTVSEPHRFDPEHDRLMLCGSMAMIKETGAMLEDLGFSEGSNSRPGEYVIERAFVG